jgi:hypothetical protein
LQFRSANAAIQLRPSFPSPPTAGKAGQDFFLDRDAGFPHPTMEAKNKNRRGRS